MLKKNIGLILILVFVVGFAILMLNQQRTDAIIAKYELNLEDKQDLINRLENGEFEDGLRGIFNN